MSERYRLDKWLWAARFYKTRALAADDVEHGRISVNEQARKARARCAKATWSSCGRRVRSAPSSCARSAGNAARRTRRRRSTRRRRKASRRRAAEAAERKLHPEPALGIEQGRPTKRDRRRLADWNRWSASADTD